MNHQFVVMWDCNGLEYVCDITERQGRRLWNRLKDDPDHAQVPNIMHLRLRAQFNAHRHYEIYLFEAQSGISEQDVIAMFESSPQAAADTIRELGHCFYSDRQTSQAKIV